MKFSQGYEKIKTCFDELEVLLCGGSGKERLGNWIDGDPITPTNQYRYKLVESFTNDDLINLKENMRFIQDLLEVFLKTPRRERLRRLVENAGKLSKYERGQFLSLHELIPVEKLSRH